VTKLSNRVLISGILAPLAALFLYGLYVTLTQASADRESVLRPEQQGRIAISSCRIGQLDAKLQPTPSHSQ
jgi:hypothetical protein